MWGYDLKAIKKLYVTQGKTIQETAKLLGLTRKELLSAMARAGIEKRTQGRKSKKKISERMLRLERLYLREKRTQAEVARILGVSLSTISKVVKAANISPPKRATFENLDVEQLKDLYAGRGMTLLQTAKVLGCSVSSVWMAIRHAGIPTRPRGTSLDIEEIIRLYINEGLTHKQIADRYGVTTQTIGRRLTSRGITRAVKKQRRLSRTTDDRSLTIDAGQITIKQNDQIVPLLQVSDIGRAVAFYTGVLDFELSWPGEEFNDFCVELRRGAAKVFLTVFDGTPRIAICVLVDEVDDLFAQYVQRGLIPGDANISPVHAAPLDQTWGNREFYVNDPDGNTLRFQTPIKPMTNDK
jgi:DNA-binding CsgD family transcriptional regulator/catechol 2,3-dioxygenase-like lactoylglutathione lyase family enzyme